LRGLGLLDAARDTLNGHDDERRIDPEDLLRMIRYERVKVYEDLGGHRRAHSSEFEKLHAEKPQILRIWLTVWDCRCWKELKDTISLVNHVLQKVTYMQL
jgi:hypothetical protein